MYDVYSDLFKQPPSLWDRLTSLPSPRTYSGGVAVVDETKILPDGGFWPQSTAKEFQDRHSDKAFKLQRKFSLPNYVLITKSEEDHVFREDEECLTFQRNYPGYFRFIELYGVDFNRDQTRASVTIHEGWKRLCKQSYSGSATYLELEKNRNGKWRVKENHGLSVDCPG